MDNATFNQLKQEAINIWETYDDTHGYATEKISRLNALENRADNWGTIVGMFDIKNQRKLYEAVGEDGKNAIDYWVGGLDIREKQARDTGIL